MAIIKTGKRDSVIEKTVKGKEKFKVKKSKHRGKSWNTLSAKDQIDLIALKISLIDDQGNFID